MSENDINKILNSDTHLREAINRREQKTPPMPHDLNARLMQRMQESDKPSKSYHRWIYFSVAAAASVLLLLTLHHYLTQEHTHTVVAQKTMTETPSLPLTDSSQPLTDNAPTSTITADVSPSTKTTEQAVTETRSKKTASIKKATRKRSVATKTQNVEAQPVTIAENTSQHAAMPVVEEDIPESTPDPFLTVALQAQEIRARGERMEKEIAQFKNQIQ